MCSPLEYETMEFSPKIEEHGSKSKGVVTEIPMRSVIRSGIWCACGDHWLLAFCRTPHSPVFSSCVYGV